MLISRLELKNWRNFKDVDIPMGLRAFFIGPNASGKSNLLDAFRFLRDIAKPGGGLQKAVTDRGGLSKIRCLAARAHPNVELGIELGESAAKGKLWKYVIGIKQESRGSRKPFLAYEKVYRGKELIVNRPDEDDKKDQLRLTQTYLEQINTNKKFRDISKFLVSILYLHIVPQLLRFPDTFTGPGISGDPFGRNFLERVAKTPKKYRSARLKKIEKVLCVAVPQIKKLTQVDDRGVPHLEAIYEHWRAKGARQREDQFSDGTLRLLGLLWALLDGDSLLLLEEPELSLNTGIITKIPAMIYKLQRQKKRQVIITTHSYELLSDKSIDGREVVLLMPGGEGTTVEIASAISDVKDLLASGMSVGDAVLPKTMPEQLKQLGLF
ncbi:AAA family ATPase [bacterium]|nr:AAA family ATPase [bacterium]